MKKILNEIAEVTAGQGAPQGDENYSIDGTPFIKAGNLYDLINGESIDSIQKVNDDIASKYRLKKFPAGTVVFAKSGMSCLKGYVYVMPTEAYVVNHLACIVPDLGLSEYLKFYFMHHKPSELIKDSSYPSIRLSDISDIVINLPELSECMNIVKILNNTERVIKIKKLQLIEFDQLIKSRFVEMFGDPELNEKEFPMLSFRDICSVRQGLQIPISKRLTIQEKNSFKYITVAYINGKKEEEYIPNPKESVICTKDDLLMTRTGNTGMVVTNVEGVFHNNFFLIDFKRDRYNKIFLYHYLNLEFIQAEILKRAGTSTIPDINHSEFYKIKIFDAPIELQNNYAKFVEQVDKLKFEVQKSLSETQMLFDALMQEYFG